MVLMSADNDPKAARDGDYTFKMPQKIPSYLLAIAAGDLVFEPISERAGVWAEPAHGEEGRRRVRRHREDDRDRRAAVRPVPLGPLRHPGAAAVVPVRRHGEPAPDLRHADGHRRRQVAGVAGRARAGAQLVRQPGDVRHAPRTRWLNEGFTSYVENRLVEALYGKERADMETRDRAQRAEGRVQDRRPEAAGAGGEARRAEGSGRQRPAPRSTPRARGSCSSSSSVSAAQNFDAFLRGYFDHFAFQSIATDAVR